MRTAAVTDAVLRDASFSVPPDAQRIQFKSALTANGLQRLGEILQNRPDLELRVYGRDGSISDLRFLADLPPIRNLSVEVAALLSLDGIETSASALSNLLLGETARSLDLSPIEGLLALERLYIERHPRIVGYLPALSTLRSLTLRGIKLRRSEDWSAWPALEALDLKLGSIESLEPVAAIGSLEYLELWSVNGVDSLDPLGDSPIFELYLQALDSVTDLHPLAKLRNLRRLTLQGMHGVPTLDFTASMPALEQLLVSEMPHLSTDDYLALAQAPALEEVALAPEALTRLLDRGEAFPFPGVEHAGRHPALRSTLSRPTC